MQLWKSILIFCLVPGFTQAAAFQVRVDKVEGEVEFLRDGAEGGATPLSGGEVLGENDRLYTGMESQATLSFPDGSTVVVKELTDMKIATLDQKGDAVKTRLWLKAGEVSAEVTHDRPVAADFQIKTPTATCSVRGTQFTVRHTVQGTFTYTSQGQVATSSGSGQTSNAGAGQENQSGEDGEMNDDSELNSDEAHSNTNAGGVTGDEADSSDGEFQTVTPPVNVADVSNPSGGNSFIQEATNFEEPEMLADLPLPPPGADPEFRSFFLYETKNAQIHTGNLGSLAPDQFSQDQTFASITTQGTSLNSRGFVSREIALSEGVYKVTGVVNFLTSESGMSARNDLFIIELRPAGTSPGTNDALFRAEIGAVTTNEAPTVYQEGTVTGIPEDVIAATTARQTGWQAIADHSFEAPAGNYVLEASVQDVDDSVIDSAALIDNLDVVPTTPVLEAVQPLP